MVTTIRESYYNTIKKYSPKICIAILLLVFCQFQIGCAYFADRCNDFVDIFKLDIGVIGAGAEAHCRLTDAVVTGVGFGSAIKIGFKGRHSGKPWVDSHIGLPFSILLWFTTNDSYLHKDFPITYYCIVGNKAVWSMDGTIEGMNGSYECDSAIIYPVKIRKNPRQFPLKLELDNGSTINEIHKNDKPFNHDTINAFDLEIGGTLAIIIGISFNAGISPGQFVDFVLGWFGIDIADDDSFANKLSKTTE